MNLKSKIKKLVKKILKYNKTIQYKSYTDSELELLEKELIQIDGKEIITSNRLDIIVRYLLFKDIANEVQNEAHKSLYARTILSRTGGVEPTTKFTTDAKTGILQHIEKAKELCESIKENGFNKKFFVPIDKKFALFNGAHRIAASIALNEKIWVKFYNEDGIADFNFNWFCENNFTTEDKIRILRGFADLYEDCGIFVLYAPVLDKWDYIEKQISKNINIVGSVELDFSNNYFAFENAIHDIYNSYFEDEENLINRKIQLLKFAPLKLKVILVSNEKNKEKDLHKQIIDIKGKIRKNLNFDVDEKVFLSLHSSDDKEEFLHLKQTLLSVNNLNYINKRINVKLRKKFMDWISEYKKECKKLNIPLEKTCIVGSSPLEVLGIRNSTDIDIVVPCELRLKYGNGVTHVTDDLDICTLGYADRSKDLTISDDILINDDNYHFIFNGCKFSNLDLVYKRKKIQAREKDLKDVRLIEIFNDYSTFFDNKEILKKQIERELIKRK